MEGSIADDLLIDEIDNEVLAYWERRAALHSSTVEAEVRRALTQAVFDDGAVGLGTLITSLFQDCPFEPGEIEEIRSMRFDFPDFSGPEYGTYDDEED